MLEGGHLVGLAAEGDPEELVLPAEDVGHRRTAHAPPRAGPRRLLPAARECAEHRVDAQHPLLGHEGTVGEGHGAILPPRTDTTMSEDAMDGFGVRSVRDVLRYPSSDAGRRCSGSGTGAKTLRVNQVGSARTSGRGPATARSPDLTAPMRSRRPIQ